MQRQKQGNPKKQGKEDQGRAARTVPCTNSSRTTELGPHTPYIWQEMLDPWWTGLWLSERRFATPSPWTPLRLCLAHKFAALTWLPFTPNFLQINSPPFFLGIFSVIFTGIRCGVDIAQKPNKSGQILDQSWKIFFVIFTKLIPRRMFFCIAKILVLMVNTTRWHDPTIVAEIITSLFRSQFCRARLQGVPFMGVKVLK